MDHYSIRATDINLKKLDSSLGWHIGDELKYLVKNGTWSSQVHLYLRFNELGIEHFQAKIIYLTGDRDKLQNDHEIILLVLREKLENQNIELMEPLQN